MVVFRESNCQTTWRRQTCHKVQLDGGISISVTFGYQQRSTKHSLVYWQANCTIFEVSRPFFLRPASDPYREHNGIVGKIDNGRWLLQPKHKNQAGPTLEHQSDQIAHASSVKYLSCDRLVGNPH